jgi:hypothetical protein
MELAELAVQTQLLYQQPVEVVEVEMAAVRVLVHQLLVELLVLVQELAVVAVLHQPPVVLAEQELRSTRAVAVAVQVTAPELL